MKANFLGIRKSIITIFSISLLLSFFLCRSIQHQTADSKGLIEISELDSNKAKDNAVSTMETVAQPIKASLVSNKIYQTTEAFAEYQPEYFQASIDSSNYGDRYSTDIDGKVLNNQPIAVLHETVGSAMSAINTFRTNHSSDRHQSSYHALITLHGTIIYLVPSNKRAFGAGNSVFKSPLGTETVRTNPNLPSSVNNFAYHISLETPVDGRTKSGNSYHSGYTDEQYKSLAWLLALSSIPDARITTHKAVDLSGHRFDPRSFDFDKFLGILHTYRQPMPENISTQ